METPGASTKHINYANCKTTKKYPLLKRGGFIPQHQPSKTKVQSSFETREILRSVARLQETAALTLDQAAKALTLAAFNMRPFGEDITEIERAWTRLNSTAPQDAIANYLGAIGQQLEVGNERYVRELHELGYTLIPGPGGDGNSSRNLNPYDTDVVLNRGDFEQPSFGGQGTHM